MMSAMEVSMQEKPELVLSRPADKSLAAFKEWVNESVKALNGDTSQDLTETKWEEAWKQFWAE
jgi:hypothetical protein